MPTACTTSETRNEIGRVPVHEAAEPKASRPTPITVPEPHAETPTTSNRGSRPSRHSGGASPVRRLTMMNPSAHAVHVTVSTAW